MGGWEEGNGYTFVFNTKYLAGSNLKRERVYLAHIWKGPSHHREVMAAGGPVVTLVCRTLHILVEQETERSGAEVSGLMVTSK